MGALSFSSPLLLVALIALPALWFLLRATPPAPQQVKFPAFDLLRRLAKSPETPSRTPWWILLLRLMIAGLAIIALAGPVLNAPPPPQSSGPLVLVVDDSWAAAPSWRLRRDAIETLADQAARARREAYVIATVGDGDAPPEPLTGAELRDIAAELRPQALLPDYRKAIARISALKVRNADVVWLSDGLDHPGAREFAARLKRLGAVVLTLDNATPTLALFPAERAQAQLTYRVARVGAAGWRGDLVALAGDGRELARTKVDIAAGDASVAAGVDLPLALQNEIREARLAGVASAGAVQLADVRDRRALIGFARGGEAGADPLLSGKHYVEKALEPYAMFVADSLDALLKSEASVIILDDVGVLRPNDVDALNLWVENGGVVVRFAGPTLAEAAQERAPPLLPVALRGGGRAFGGALTWETPQKLGAFAEDGPFAGLAPPTDVRVRRQVLAEPGGETSVRTWAGLSDGTPLVTGVAKGAGAVALFHVTATPEWSDLPLSTTFIEMMRRLVFLSALGPGGEANDQRKVAPYRLLDGFGALRQPPKDFPAASASEIAAGPAPERPPGLYGAPEAPIALNAVGAGDVFKPLALAGVAIRPYAADPPLKFGPPLIVAALILLIIDGLVALRIAGRLAFAAAAAFVAALAPPPPARAEPLDPPVDAKAMEAALAMRLAYVRTGDAATDRAAEAGLAGLTRELARRTSSEPAPPAGVNPETDDLSVYPFLYWPIVAGAGAPSEEALANLETFMRFGGLIVFDTRDDERAVDGAETPESLALKAILGGLDLPPLAPATDAHVLKRSFYLLPDLPGRMATRPIWVQAGEGPNDSVTPVIIGGRDWAGAWASDALGRPLFPMGAGGERARELAYRAGINMVMVALTGNYKSDQVHTPILLERLGRK